MEKTWTRQERAERLEEYARGMRSVSNRFDAEFLEAGASALRLQDELVDVLTNIVGLAKTGVASRLHQYKALIDAADAAIAKAGG